MARRAKQGEDPGALAGSLTDKMRIIREVDDEVTALEAIRKKTGEDITAARGRLKSAGILQADFNVARRIRKLEGDERSTSIDTIRICCEALGIGAQGTLFPEASTGAAPAAAKPEVKVETRGRGKGKSAQPAAETKPASLGDFKAQKEAAKAAGRQAFKDGKTLDDCPYTEEPLRVAWVTGFDLEAEEAEAGKTGKGGKGKPDLAGTQTAGHA